MVLLTVATGPSTRSGLMLRWLGWAVGGCPGGRRCPHQGELLGAQGLHLSLIGAGWKELGGKCVLVGSCTSRRAAVAVSMWLSSTLAWLTVSW